MIKTCPLKPRRYNQLLIRQTQPLRLIVHLNYRFNTIAAMKTTRYSALIITGLLFLISGCEKNTENNRELPVGQLKSHSDCKLFKTAGSEADIPDTISCVSYVFDASADQLSLTHVNAGFNCCPDSLYCNILVNNDTIIIQEFEKSALCRCNCLYDLEIEISGLEIKKYLVRFIEPYSGEQEKIIFEVDLTLKNAGSYCVTRTQYPWGE